MKIVEVLSPKAKPPIDDSKIEKIKKLFKIPQDKVDILWRHFTKYSRGGFLHADDFFNKYLNISKSRIALSMFELMDTRNDESLTFDEFLKIICTFATFSTIDLVRFCFYALDMDRTGTVEKNEVKHFVYDMWDNNLTSNTHTGLSYLDRIDDGDSRYNFQEFFEMHVKYPQLLYPVFRLQQVVIQRTLGETWWEWKRVHLIEEKLETKEKNAARIKQEQIKNEKEALKANDYMVKKRMGISWYLFPWLRDSVRARINKMVAISNEIDQKELAAANKSLPQLIISND